jgi:hypothetical protein
VKVNDNIRRLEIEAAKLKVAWADIEMRFRFLQCLLAILDRGNDVSEEETAWASSASPGSATMLAKLVRIMTISISQPAKSGIFPDNYSHDEVVRQYILRQFRI